MKKFVDYQNEMFEELEKLYGKEYRIEAETQHNKYIKNYQRILDTPIRQEERIKKLREKHEKEVQSLKEKYELKPKQA